MIKTNPSRFFFAKCPVHLLVFCGFLFLFLGKAQGQADSLRQVLASSLGKEKITAYLDLSFELCRDPLTAEEARELSLQGLRMAETLPDNDPFKARRKFGLNEIASISSIRLSEFDRAQEFAMAALSISRSLPDSVAKTWEGRSFSNLPKSTTGKASTTNRLRCYGPPLIFLMKPASETIGRWP